MRYRSSRKVYSSNIYDWAIKILPGVLLVMLMGGCQQSTAIKPAATATPIATENQAAISPAVGYHLLVPEGEPPTTGWPVIVAVHGLGGNGQDACDVWATPAKQHNYLLVCPSFVEEYWQLAQGEAEALDAILTEVETTHPLNQIIYLTGISAGGRFTHVYTFQYPEKVRAAAIVADASKQSYDAGALDVPLFIAMGAKDTQWARRLQPLVADLKKQGFQVTSYLSPDAGHEWSPDIVQKTLVFFNRIQQLN
ncbi:MAG: hypothetical protein F6K19_00955 [Cyanothece sp. SIO1E1]|nr:hypothetical protein [Cyanothece sp. SIO1E1]